MSRLHINIGSQGSPTTVSDMRRRLARALANLPGDTEVTFDFRAEIEDYKPAPPRNMTMPAILVAPYNFSEPWPWETGLQKYVWSLEGENVVHGPLAAPENE